MWPFKKVKPRSDFEIAGDHAVFQHYSGSEAYCRVPETYEGVPVTEISANAFKDAKHVKAIYTGENIQKIGKKAFFGCDENLSLILNEKAERADGALLGVKSIYFESASGLTLVSYAGHETDIVLESECFRQPVTAIGEKVFYMFAYLKTVRLPKCLKSIGRAAFAGCSDLTKIDFPSSLEEIDKEAFVKSGLTEVTLPENLKTVGEKAFFACADLKSARFLGKDTFLSAGAFAKCALERIDLPENLTELQSEVLRENKRLTKIVLPGTVEAVWEYALADTALASIELPENTEVIAEGAFANSPELESVYLGSRIREIGQSAFSFCPKLKSLNLTEGKFRIENALLMDTEENRVIACLAPVSPGKVVVPDGIIEISDSAFAGNGKIEVLILPESVKRMGAWALRDMKNLKTLEIRSENLAFGDNPLFGTDPENLICTDEIAEAFEEMNS